MVVPSGCDLVCQPRYAGTAKVLRVSRRMVRDSSSFFMIIWGFGIRDSGRRLFGDSGFAIRDTDLFGDSGLAIRDADLFMGFGIRDSGRRLFGDSGFGTPIIFGVGDSRSRVHRLIAGAVAARVVAAAPEGLSLLSAFLDYALEHRFATFGAEWCIG